MRIIGAVVVLILMAIMAIIGMHGPTELAKSGPVAKPSPAAKPNSVAKIRFSPAVTVREFAGDAITGEYRANLNDEVA